MPPPSVLTVEESPARPADDGRSSSRLVANNAVLFVGAGAASALNYLFHPVLGRILSVQQFGEVQALNSILVQLLISFAVLQIIVVNVVGNLRRSGDSAAFVQAIEKVIMAAGVMIALAVAVSSSLIRHALQLESVTPVLLIAPAFGLGAIRSVRTGLLQAQQRFGSVSAVEITAGGSRLVLAGSLAAFGFGTAGATLGLVASMPLAILTATHLGRQALRYRDTAERSAEPKPDDTTEPTEPTEHGVVAQLRPHARFAIRAAWTALLVGMFVNGDNLVAKLVFDPETAGEYAGVSIISRIVFFVTASVAAVLLTSVKTETDPRENLRSYAQSAAILAVPATAAVVLFTLAPDLIVRLLVGDAYTEYSEVLPSLALAMLGFALVNLIVSFHLAVRDPGIGPVVTLALASMIAIVLAEHGTPNELARSVMIGSGVAFTLCLGWTVRWNVRALRPD